MKQWFGASDAKTSKMCFHGSKKNHALQFSDVLDTLRTLLPGGHAELAYVDDESAEMVVAYRFTSDAAYDKYMSRLLALGGSLGRGVWNPFADDYQYYQFFGCPNGANHGCTDYNSCMKLQGGL